MALGGCSNPAPISASPITNATTALGALGGGSASDLVTTGILNAQYNLDNAVKVGALAATDPAPACVDQAVAIMGIGGTPAASFTPKISDAISAGSVGYIYFQQVKSLTGGSITLPQSCLAILGQMVLDVQKGVNQAAIGALIPGAGIIP